MADNTTDSDTQNPEATAAGDKKQQARRDIQGGLPYSVSPGVFKRGLEGIITAERPEKFTNNFVETVLRLSGGSARAIPPLLKKMKFLNSDGTPTELYSKFKTDSGRTGAALEGLRSAFAELFRRNEVIHKADESAVIDAIVETNGLKRSDPIVRHTHQTFEAIRGFIDRNAPTSAPEVQMHGEEPGSGEELSHTHRRRSSTLGLSYQINIVLPETDNIEVFNAIFRSLRENLL